MTAEVLEERTIARCHRFDGQWMKMVTSHITGKMNRADSRLFIRTKTPLWLVKRFLENRSNGIKSVFHNQHIFLNANWGCDL